MASNTRFAVAIHTAGMLAVSDCMPVTSESIAQSVQTNPVVVRRVIGMLAKHGLVTVRKGQTGGATLSRPASQITLDEIYRAVGSGSLFRLPAPAGKCQCPIARFVGPVLLRVFGGAEEAMLERLRSVTLADVLRSVGSQMKSEKCGSR